MAGRERDRGVLGCCLLIAVTIAVPLLAVAVGGWLLFRARRRIVDGVRERFGIELPERWLTSLPAAAYSVYRDVMAELDDDRKRDA